MNKKKKSTNTSPYPDEAIDRLARAFYPAILACWNSEEGQREFAAWQAEQAHHTTSKEKQSVPDGERPVIHIAIVCGFLQGASGRAHPVFSLLYIRCTKLRILMGETIPLYRAMTSHFLWASRTMPLHKQGQELRSEQPAPPLHEQNPSTYFCALTIRKHLSNLSGQRPSICCRRPRCRLKAPLGLSLLRCAAQTRFHPKPCLERTRRNCVKLTQFLRSSSCGSSCKITLGIFQGFFQKFLQLIRIIIHPMVRLRKFNIVVWNVVQNVRSH